MNSSVGLRAMSDSTQQHRRLPDAGNGARAAASGGCFDQSSGSNSHQSAPASAASDPMGVFISKHLVIEHWNGTVIDPVSLHRKQLVPKSSSTMGF